MAEVITQIQRQGPEQHKPRERLSDEETGNYLSFLGNHEAKAITLIVMGNGNVFDKGNLHREVLNAQGNNKGWRMDRGIPFQYCSHDFVSIGLVKEALSGYAITDDGKKLGIPLAGLLLDFSERHNIPLSLLFGITLSGSKSKTIQTKEGKDIEFRKRSPSTTLKILYELLTSPNLPIRMANLEKRMRENTLDDVIAHLARLSKLGLIQYANNKQFEINITDEQRIILTELLEIIDGFQNQDKETLEKGRRLAGEIIINPQRVSDLLRRAKEASSYTNRSFQAETQERILSIIAANPNGITNKEIQKLLEKKYDKRLSAERVSSLTFSMLMNKSVKVRKEGNVNRFFPNNKT